MGCDTREVARGIVVSVWHAYVLQAHLFKRIDASFKVIDENPA